MSNFGVTKTAQEALTCKLSADLSYGSIFSSLNACTLSSQVLEGISLPDYYQNYANVVVKKQNPLLNRFYLLRQQAMHAIFVKLLTSIPSSFTDIQVLILGGGYDISYEFYNDQSRQLHYYVIDFPEIIERRMMYHVQRSQYSNKQFHYIGGDLLDFNHILQQLDDNKIDHSRPTIVLVECVLSYLPIKKVEEIISSIASKFSNCAMLLFDPLMGSDPAKNDDTSLVENQDYFHQTTGSFARKEAELQTNFSTSIKVAEFFRLNHWNHVDCLTMFQAIHLHDIIKLVEPLIINSLEVFDEFSSLQMLLNNYHITVTMNNTPWWKSFQVNALFNPLEYTPKEKEDKFNLRLRLSLEKVQSLELVRKSRKIANSGLNICIREAKASDIPSLERLYSEVRESLVEFSLLNDCFFRRHFKSTLKEVNQFKNILKMP